MLCVRQLVIAALATASVYSIVPFPAEASDFSEGLQRHGDALTGDGCWNSRCVAVNGCPDGYVDASGCCPVCQKVLKENEPCEATGKTPDDIPAARCAHGFSCKKGACRRNNDPGCSRQMTAQRRQGRPDWMAAPQVHCDSRGDFQRLQCRGTLCYCAGRDTGEPTGPLVLIQHLALLSCYDAALHGSGYLTACEKELVRTRSLALHFSRKGHTVLGLDGVACELDGSFARVQCGRPESCVCTDRDGISLKSYARDRMEFQGRWYGMDCGVFTMKAGCPSLLVLVPLFLCVAVQALPTGHKAGPGEHVPDEVEQLDQLRKAMGSKATKVVESESSQVLNVDGRVRASSNKEKTVKDAQSGAMLASVKQTSKLEQRGPGERPHSVSRTQLDVPALGIHDTKIEDSNNNKNLPQSVQQQQQLLPGLGQAEKKNYIPYPWNPEELDQTDYTPADLAQYILRTGDEEGVAMAVEELLRMGMMNREEAIVYLQDVKAEMNYIRSQQEKLRKIQELREVINMKKKDEFKVQQHRLSEALDTREMEHPPKVAMTAKAPQKPAQQHAPNAKAAASENPKLPASSSVSKEVAPSAPSQAGGKGKAASASSSAVASSKTAGGDKDKSSATSHQGSQVESAPNGAESQKRSGAAERLMLPSGLTPSKLSVLELERLGEEQRGRSAQQQAEDDVLGALKRLRGSSLYDEYTLEEIIYWLAKDMFAHSIIKGDQSAEEALARFANFVETEVSQNKLSGEVEKKVLDIMLAALVDILREFPGAQYTGPGPNQLPQRLFPEATEHQAAKLANARVRNAAIRLREEKKKTIPAVIKHKEVATASQKS
ncbi:uncharacterized protein LOC144093463 isoform X2 [Amblyomma americanum]